MDQRGKYFGVLSVLLLLIVNCVNSVPEPQRLNVAVYYETLCSDSRYFIWHQLYPTLLGNNWLQYANLTLIPYGKASAWTDPSTGVESVSCQHFERECDLNALHACVVEHNSQEEQLKLINCLLKSRSPSHINNCAQELNIGVTAAKRCKNTRETPDILRKYGVLTDAIDIRFVPSISLDGNFDYRKQNGLLYNFEKKFCQKYKEKFNVSLSEDCSKG